MSEQIHISVLKDETLELLKTSEGGMFFDGTVGMGGHSGAILENNPDNYLYGTDKDTDALAIAKENLKAFEGRFTLFHSDFKNLHKLDIPVSQLDGLLFDLGVSSFQLDNPQKGFAYAREAPLDMRMDKTQALSAYDVVNHYSHQQLTQILKDYGEFKNPIKIVDQIVFHRRNEKIETTEQLKTIIRRVAPKQKTMDPLARVFQAIRIEVNDELGSLETFFANLIENMKPGARLAIISFHSLEDRAAKNTLKQAKQKGIMNILTKKPITAREEENKINPRARSAKLRTGERI